MRVLLQAARGLQPAIRLVIDLAVPAVVGPGGRAELDVGGDLPGELHHLGPWRGRRDRVEQLRLIRHAPPSSRFTSACGITPDSPPKVPVARSSSASRRSTVSPPRIAPAP